MVGIVLETLLGNPLELDCGLADLQRIAGAASKAGFRQCSFAEPNASNIGPHETRKIFDDLGIAVPIAEIILRWDWGPKHALDDLERKLDVLGVLGAGLTLACTEEQIDLDLGRATEGFGALCEAAAKHDIRVVLEFMPSRTPSNLATAWQIIQGCGAPNGGLDIDMMHWHYQAGGPDWDLLASIPGDRIYYSQLCDAGYDVCPPEEDYIRIAVTERPLPGDGRCDIPRVLQTMKDIGADPFFSMECYNDKLHALGAEAQARRIHEAAEQLFGERV